jgi:hypothetical protein
VSVRVSATPWLDRLGLGAWAAVMLLAWPLEFAWRCVTSPAWRRLRRTAFGPVGRARRESDVWVVSRWRARDGGATEQRLDAGTIVSARWYVFHEMWDHVRDYDILALRLRDGRQVVFESSSDSSALADLTTELTRLGVLRGKPRSIWDFDEHDTVWAIIWCVTVFFVAIWL